MIIHLEFLDILIKNDISKVLQTPHLSVQKAKFPAIIMVLSDFSIPLNIITDSHATYTVQRVHALFLYHDDMEAFLFSVITTTNSSH